MQKTWSGSEASNRRDCMWLTGRTHVSCCSGSICSNDLHFNQLKKHTREQCSPLLKTIHPLKLLFRTMDSSETLIASLSQCVWVCDDKLLVCLWSFWIAYACAFILGLCCAFYIGTGLSLSVCVCVGMYVNECVCVCLYLQDSLSSVCAAGSPVSHVQGAPLPPVPAEGRLHVALQIFDGPDHQVVHYTNQTNKQTNKTQLCYTQ